MTIKARDDVTLANVNDVTASKRYYQLKASTASPPDQPSSYPAPSPWVTAEPTYSEGATNSLYTVDVTVFSDGTFDYSTVNLSSSYEAAKAAWNKAQAAQTSATSAQTAANLALANAPELVVNGGFETGKATEWYVNAAYQVVNDMSGSHSGRYYLNADSATEIWTPTLIPVIPGHTYRFSGWYRRPSTNSSIIGGIRFQKSSDGATYADWLVTDFGKSKQDDWTYFSIDGTIPSDGSVKYARYRLAFANTTGVVQYFDDLSFKDITEAASAQKAADDAQATASLALANAQELIRNPNMDASNAVQDGWTNGVIQSSTEAPDNPPYPLSTYAKLVLRNDQLSWAIPNYTVGRTYQFSCYARADNNTTSNFAFGLHLNGGSNNTWIGAFSVTPDQGKTGWAKYTGTITIPSGSLYNNAYPWLQIDKDASQTSTNWWYVTGLSIKDITEANAAQKAANTAAQTAGTALTNANLSLSRATHIYKQVSSPDATTTPKPVKGDAWWKQNADGNVIGLQTCTDDDPVTWAPTTLIADSVLVPGSVGTVSIKDGAITGDKVLANTIEAKNMKTGTITAASGIIADATIKTAQIADGAIVTAKIGDGQIVNAKIKDGTIQNGKIANLDAGKITTGYINANVLQTNSISSTKLFVGDMTNLWPDQYFESDDVKIGSATAYSNPSVVDAPLVGNAVLLPQNTTNQYANVSFEVKKDDVFQIDFFAKTKGATSYSNVFSCDLVNYNDTNSMTSRQTTVEDVGVPDGWTSGWRHYRTSRSIASNSAKKARLYLKVNDTANQYEIANLTIRRRYKSDLIVDGSITTVKLAANSVTALKIASRAITTDKIEVGAITAEKADIGSLTMAIVSADKFHTTSGNTGFNDTDGLYSKHTDLISYSQTWDFESGKTAWSCFTSSGGTNISPTPVTTQHFSGSYSMPIGYRMANGLHVAQLFNDSDRVQITSNDRVECDLFVYSPVAQTSGGSNSTMQFQFAYYDSSNTLLHYDQTSLPAQSWHFGWNLVSFVSLQKPPSNAATIGRLNIILSTDTSALTFADLITIRTGKFSSSIRILDDDDGYPQIQIKRNGRPDWVQALPPPNVVARDDLPSVGAYNGQIATVANTQRWVFRDDIGKWVQSFVQTYMKSIVISVTTGTKGYLLISEADLTDLLGTAWDDNQCSASAMETDGAKLSTIKLDHNVSGLNMRATATTAGLTRINITIFDPR